MRFSILLFGLFLATNTFSQITSAKDTVTLQGQISWNVGHVISNAQSTNIGSLESILTVSSLITSTSEKEELIPVNVFPNPVVDNLNIVFDNVENQEYELTNSTGKIILTSNASQLNMSSQPNGIYFIKIKNNQSISHTFKIIKQ